MKRYIVDTNVLMDYPEMIKELDGEIVIPVYVIEELDKLKNNNIKARKASRLLRELDNTIVIDLDSSIEDVDMPSSLDMSRNDNKILALAKKNDYTVVSCDFLLLYKAKKIFKLNIIDALNSRYESYTGIKEVFLSKSSMEDMQLYMDYLNNPNENIFDLNVNQYLILYNKDVQIEGTYKKLDKIVRWDGERYVDLKLPPERVVKPLNDYQACAIDLVYNPDIPIKIISGTYGSGKTLIGSRIGVFMTKELGYYRRVFCIRNPIGSGQEIGFLPGSKNDKIEDFFKALEDNLEGGEQEVERLYRDGMLEFEIPFYIKGRSLENSFILVEEAEDLSVKELKLVGSRIGKNSVICFCGDYKQAEKPYISNNGLIKLINETKNNKLVGCVVLKEDVRSSASKVFAELC